MNTKHNINVLQLFILSKIVAGLLMALDTLNTNRLSTNVGRMASTIICDALAIPLFVLGATKSIKMKYSAWAALNIIAIIVILFWTVWICLVLYAFKGFHFVISA